MKQTEAISSLFETASCFLPPKADGPDARLPPVGENIFPNRGKIETDFHWHIPKNFRKFAVDRKNNDTYAEL